MSGMHKADGKRVILIGVDGMVPEILEQYIEEGKLKNLARIFKKGAYAKAIPCMTAKTPQNWTTIATGAYVGTHGVTDLHIHESGKMPLDDGNIRNGFSSEFCRAEFIWDTLEKNGKKAVVMNYACAWPPTFKKGIFVGGDGSPFSHSVFEIAPSCCFMTKSSANAACYPLEKAREGAHKLNLELSIELRPACNWSNLSERHSAALETEIALPRKDPQWKLHLLVLNSEGRGYDRILITESKDASKPLAELNVGDWSEYLRHDFKTQDGVRSGAVRFKLVELSHNAKKLKLYCPQIFPTEGFTKPEKVAKELTDRFGPFLEYAGHRGYVSGWTDLWTMLEEAEYQAHWIADAGSYLMKKYNCDLLYSKIHLMDNLNHMILGEIDPASPWYTAEKSKMYEKIMLRGYEIVDEMTERFMKQADGNTVVIIVSDHGAVSFHTGISINNLLTEKGLIVCRPGSNKPIVDWSRTKAYGVATGGHIFVNLKGREESGIVEPGEEYEKVRDEIINILQSLKDPETGENPIAIVLKREDAVVLGLYGERVGDVVYGTKPGYGGDTTWFPLTNDFAVFQTVGPEGWSNDRGMHGSGLPTQKYGRGSDYAVFLAFGSGIRKGYKRERPIRLVDVAPTISALLDIPVPFDSEGSILNDMFETR